MVLHDVFEAKPRPRDANLTDAPAEPKAFETLLAYPVDRAAAAVADLVLFLPLLSLVIAPFRRMGLEAQMAGNEGSLIAARIAAYGAGILLFAAYQTVFVAALGATPGKLALGLRVISVWHHGRPRALEAFLRAIVWIGELILCGVPFLAIFSNERRRPFHDRVADSAVIALRKNRQGGVSNISEMSIASGLQAACLAVLTLTAAAWLIESDRKSSTESWIVDEMEARGALCTEVKDARSEWLKNDGLKESDKSISRLEVALALYATDALSDECLSGEAEFALWREENKQLAYLAKALTASSDAKLQSAYFEKVCQGNQDSDPCRVIGLIQEPENDDEPGSPEEKAAQTDRENKVAEIIDTVQPTSPLYVKVWAVRQLMQDNQNARALQVMELVAPQRDLANFFTTERTKALWLIGDTREANRTLRSAIELMDTNSRVELTRWACWNETAMHGCSEDSQDSCRALLRTVAKSQSWLRQNEVAAAFIRGEICLNGTSPGEISKISDGMLNPEAKLFLAALAKANQAKDSKDFAPLKKIASGDLGTGRFFIEANLRLIDLAETADEARVLRDRWLTLPTTDEGWRPLGARLMKRLVAIHAWDDSFIVGLKLIEVDHSDLATYRALVVAAYRAGHTPMALSLIEKLKEFHLANASNPHDATKQESSDAQRMPASLDGFDEVLRELKASPKDVQ